MTVETLDLTGLKCPLPVLRTRKALRALAPGSSLEVIATDPMSAIDIPNLVRETGDALLAQSRDGERLIFRIAKAPADRDPIDARHER